MTFALWNIGNGWRKKIVPLLALFCCAVLMSQGHRTNSIAKTYPVIPAPQEINYGKQEIFFSRVSINADQFSNEARILKDFLSNQGIESAEDGLKIQFKKKGLTEDQNEEAYELLIDNEVTITAPTAKGVFYGIQTLKQLFRLRDNEGVLPKARIADWPAFKIRGFMHDTARNFQSVEQLKEQIEVLANYKFNVFHWHLTDDPAWRLESKRYPELNAGRTMTRGKGKFYTQEDFRDILAFCRERYITVIPEFDIPGHTAAFRKAFGLTSMRDPKVLPVLLDLFGELCSLADEKEMPYIHIGTDEVRNEEEYGAEHTIESIMDFLKRKKREVIVWKEGIQIDTDTTSIQQLWAMHEPDKGYRFIDSRANYINHLDPFAGMVRLFFQQPTRQPAGDSLALGGILCAWPDNNVADDGDILGQNPIYPAMVFYSDAIWHGKGKNHTEYWSKLPPVGTPEFTAFQNFEKKVLVHRNLFFEGKEFPYVKQTDIRWQLLGPLDHNGNFNRSFAVETKIQEKYTIDEKEYKWTGPEIGGTLHLKHFFGFPSRTDNESGTYYAYTELFSPDDRIQDFWIGFHGWSRSGGRRGGPFPGLGQWYHTEPKIWVNGTEIEPPIWQQPNLGIKTDEIPFIDEDYFYREPTKISLKNGWNRILLKIPHNESSWKWMFTCVPIQIQGKNVREAHGLQFKTN